MNATLEPDFSNKDIMVKLAEIEERIQKIDKRAGDIIKWLWGVLLGRLIGFMWDDIVGFSSSIS